MTRARSPVIRGSRERALWLATLGFFGGFAGVAVFGPLVPRFAAVLHLTALQGGLLAAIASLTGSLLRIPFGAWVDRVGGRRPFLTLLGLAFLGVAGLTVLLATRYPDHMAGTYPALLILGMLAGCGIAAFSVGVPQVSYWFPRAQQGGPLGIYAGLGNLAPGIFSGLLPVAVGALGLVGAYVTWLLLVALIMAVYAIGITDAPWFQLRQQGLPADERELATYGQELVPATSAAEGFRQASSEAATWALVAFYFTSFGGFIALTAWLPTYWHEVYRVSLVQGGLLTLTFSAFASLVRVPGGLLADRLPITYALQGNFLLIGIGALAMALSGQFAVSLAATLVIALGMGLQNAVVFKLLPRYVPHAVGSASGLVGGLGAFGGFVIPPVMGAIAGALGAPHGYARGFLVFVVLVVIDLVFVWLLGGAYEGTTRAPGGVSSIHGKG
ncbi:MAG TPA: MFS transporter [bacterium]|nr:MFS transporter [bacterium]